MPATESEIRVLVVYYSRFGVLKLLAERIAEGARAVDGVAADLLEVGDRPVGEPLPDETDVELGRRRATILQQFASADALIVGAPAYFGSMASPVKRLFEDCVTASVPLEAEPSRPWRHLLFRNKVGAAFTASATPHGGNESTLHSILTMMMHLGMILVTPGQQPPILENEGAPYGATAVSGPDGRREPGPDEQEAARALGRLVGEVAVWLSIGQRAHEQARRKALRKTARSEGPFDPSA